MEPDSSNMQLRRDLAVLLFALREGDVRLAELIARALFREASQPCAAGGPTLSGRTLDRLFTMLGLDDPPA